MWKFPNWDVKSDSGTAILLNIQHWWKKNQNQERLKEKFSPCFWVSSSPPSLIYLNAMGEWSRIIHKSSDPIWDYTTQFFCFQNWANNTRIHSRIFTEVTGINCSSCYVNRLPENSSIEMIKENPHLSDTSVDSVIADKDLGKLENLKKRAAAQWQKVKQAFTD